MSQLNSITFGVKVSIKIYWSNIRNYGLPNELKEILYDRNIITSSLASKLPTFNYASFYQTFYIGASDCLKDLSELHCYSDICPQFFYQSSQICHNIQLFDITFTKVISNGLKDLISVQQNLKNLQIFLPYDCDDSISYIIVTSLKTISNTVIILCNHYIPLSFISKFINLQELIFRFLSYNKSPFEEFNELQYIKFSKLQYLEFNNVYPRNELLINFLEEI
ncbi:unnamed protein product [Rhizophagus irregularis]|nr:unnamed protein product [Rhizophagus irregularis]